MPVEFVGGPDQAEFMSRVRGLDPARVLLVPVDVGKWEAMAMVTDLHGEIVTPPFKFAMTDSGVKELAERTDRAQAARNAEVCRFGVEAAGHYHRPLVNRLVADRVEVVELNPAAVSHMRAQHLRARSKSDVQDLAAIADLLSHGAGRTPQRRDEAVVEQAAWVAHRARKVEVHRRLRQQIHAQLDLVFPGLTACFEDIFKTKSGMMVLTELCSPERVAHLGAKRLIRFGATRGIRVTTPTAERIVTAARDALGLPDSQRVAAEAILAADAALFQTLHDELERCETRLEEILPDTPAAVLTSLPGIGTIRASAYGAALGDHTRFANAAAAYAFAGLTPASYESAGRSRAGLGITRAGSVKLRQAILELGKGLGGHHPDFVDYRAELLARKKAPKVTLVAVSHRAHRLAFAMVRDQTRWDPDHQGAGRPVTSPRTGAGTT